MNFSCWLKKRIWWLALFCCKKMDVQKKCFFLLRMKLTGRNLFSRHRKLVSGSLILITEPGWIQKIHFDKKMNFIFEFQVLAQKADLVVGSVLLQKWILRKNVFSFLEWNSLQKESILTSQETIPEFSDLHYRARFNPKNKFWKKMNVIFDFQLLAQKADLVVGSVRLQKMEFQKKCFSFLDWNLLGGIYSHVTGN